MERIEICVTNAENTKINHIKILEIDCELFRIICIFITNDEFNCTEILEISCMH